MQLRNARLCLDCEEVHDDQHCPVCASDSFAYMSRWVPVEERRTKRRATVTHITEPRRSSRGKWVAGGALGIAAFAAGRMLFRKTDAPADADTTDTPPTDPPDSAA